MSNSADSRLAAYLQSTTFFFNVHSQIKAVKSNNSSFEETILANSLPKTQKPSANGLYASLGIADIRYGESDFGCLELKAKEYYHFHFLVG